LFIIFKDFRFGNIGDFGMTSVMKIGDVAVYVGQGTEFPKGAIVEIQEVGDDGMVSTESTDGVFIHIPAKDLAPLSIKNGDMLTLLCDFGVLRAGKDITYKSRSGNDAFVDIGIGKKIKVPLRYLKKIQ
jgi:hypothetical protein